MPEVFQPELTRMPRWFLSYHSPDQALAERLKAAIERKDSASRVFFAPTNLRAGGSWSAQLAQEIADATAFILLIGAAGIGKWQVPEYDEALDKWVKSDRKFPLIVVLLEGQTAPGLPFLRQLHWIVTPDPASREGHRRAYLTRPPAAAQAPANYGATRHPIAALRRWRRRTAIISLAASAKPSRCCRACRRARPAAGADRQFRRRQILAGAGGRAGGAQAPSLAGGGAARRMLGRRLSRTAGNGASCRSSRAPIR